MQRFVSQRPLAHTWTCELGAPIVKTKHIIYLALIAISVVVALYYLPVREPLLAAAEWARLNPFVAAPLYLLVYVAALILMIPAWTLMLAGGYLFGTTAGMVIVVLANIAGSIATFILEIEPRHTEKMQCIGVPWRDFQDPSIALLGAIQATGLVSRKRAAHGFLNSL